MRTITEHVVNELNDKLEISVLDEPGAGGANHSYLIMTPDPLLGCLIKFQNGPIAEAGVNGVTHEALLVVVIDRLRSFQAGPFACRENAIALTHIETGLHWLQQRTRDRMRRGVEGKTEK